MAILQHRLLNVRLLVVNAEHLIHGQLDDWLTAASKHGLIKRIIFDEAHEILVSSNYRDCYSKVQSLMDLGVTIVFLTATIYRQSIPELAKAFNIENLEVIAAPTLRTNIRYQVDTYGDEQLVLAFLIEACREAFEHAAPRDRLLIYCRSYDECDRVAATLRLPVHKSKYTDDPDADAVTRNRVEQDWLMGVKQGLVATTGFGTGINYPYVTHVFILNPYDMVTVTQQTGRLGRTGEVTYARIIGYTPGIANHPPSQASTMPANTSSTNCSRRILAEGFPLWFRRRGPFVPLSAGLYLMRLLRESRGGQSTSGSGGQITSGSSDSVTGSTSMIFDKSKRPAVHAYHDIADGHLNPPPTQTFFDKHAIRSVTSPLPSTSRPHGHHEALALNKQAGVTKRDLAQDRSQSFKRLVDMRDRCLTCQVFGRTPCGTEDAFRCPVGIYGYRCQYMVDGEALPTLYADVYKTALRNFTRPAESAGSAIFLSLTKRTAKMITSAKCRKTSSAPSHGRYSAFPSCCRHP
ncbi:ATP-dependent DNA helicase [Salix suchowensis]|nr:ATP-dependent DNA helicase [Salix suchowensis]